MICNTCCYSSGAPASGRPLLIEEWHQAQLFIDQIRNMADWLTEPGHFRELLDFIYKKQDEMGKRQEGPPATRTLWELYQEDFENDEHDE